MLIMLIFFIDLIKKLQTMKKIIAFLLAVICIFASGCMALKGKTHIVLVEAPANTIVTHNGEALLIEDVIAARSETGSGNMRYVTLYKYPGVKIKVKKETSIELKSNSKKVNVAIRSKPAIGMLILEGIFTFGIATIIDLTTNSYNYTKERFVDVPAYLQGGTPRSQKELKQVVLKNF